MLFKGLDLDRVLSHGGYTGNFTLLYGVALWCIYNVLRAQRSPAGMKSEAEPVPATAEEAQALSVTHVPY